MITSLPGTQCCRGRGTGGCACRSGKSLEEAAWSESWVIRLEHQTGSTTAEGCECGTVPEVNETSL